MYMYDKRLIGTWKSDKRRTVQDIAARRDIPPKNKKSRYRMFGKLTLRYTRTHFHSIFEELSEVRRYRVVAKNESSVVTLNLHPLAGKQIHHIRFEGEYHWICLGKFREYFKRVAKRKR
jgi:hypothetical protein